MSTMVTNEPGQAMAVDGMLELGAHGGRLEVIGYSRRHVSISVVIWRGTWYSRFMTTQPPPGDFMTTQPPPGDRFMMSQPAPASLVTTQPLGMGDLMTTQPPPGDFMTTQPPPGAIRDDMLVYECIKEMTKHCMLRGKLLTSLLDLSTRHFRRLRRG